MLGFRPDMTLQNWPSLKALQTVKSYSIIIIYYCRVFYPYFCNGIGPSHDHLDHREDQACHWLHALEIVFHVILFVNCELIAVRRFQTFCWFVLWEIRNWNHGLFRTVCRSAWNHWRCMALSSQSRSTPWKALDQWLINSNQNISLRLLRYDSESL